MGLIRPKICPLRGCRYSYTNCFFIIFLSLKEVPVQSASAVPTDAPGQVPPVVSFSNDEATIPLMAQPVPEKEAPSSPPNTVDTDSKSKVAPPPAPSPLKAPGKKKSSPKPRKKPAPRKKTTKKKAAQKTKSPLFPNDFWQRFSFWRFLVCSFPWGSLWSSRWAMQPENFQERDSCRTCCPLPWGSRGLVLILALVLVGWYRLRSWLNPRFLFLPAALAILLALTAGALSLRGDFFFAFSQFRMLVGGREEAARVTLTHQVFAAYRRFEAVQEEENH